jgi:serine/threonine-protein kinase
MAGSPPPSANNAPAFLTTEKCIPFQDEVRNNEDLRLLSTFEKERSDLTSTIETSDPRITRTGARLGTGAYMAPEQSRDPRSVDVRADIYSFGVVLFEMITGRLPFKGRSLDALSDQHSRRKPPSIAESISVRPAKLAKSVDEIVQRCLRKDPADRYKSVAELRHALKLVRAQLQHR